MPAGAPLDRRDCAYKRRDGGENVTRAAEDPAGVGGLLRRSRQKNGPIRGVKFAAVHCKPSKEGIVSTLKTMLLAVLFLSGSASLLPQGPPVPGPPPATELFLEDLIATQNFQRNVAEYVVLHQLLEREVPLML